jgi:hypothetical protein
MTEIENLTQVVRDAIRACDPRCSAGRWQMMIAAELHSRLTITPCLEFEIPDRGDGMRGFIDIVFDYQGCRVAIELDRVTPRVKSIDKLLAFPCHLRFIGLREGRDWREVSGIVIVCGKRKDKDGKVIE